MTTPPTELRASFDRYRSRIIGLNRKILYKLLETLSIPPDSTEPAHLQLIEKEEWRLGVQGNRNYNLPPSVKTPNDIFPLLSDGTAPPRQKKSEMRPVRLPDDFKQLCAWTDSITGPGLPRINNNQIPRCFSGVQYGLFTLQGYGPIEPLTVEGLMTEAYMDDGWEVGAGMRIGAYESRGGGWLCWCRSDDEVEDDEQLRLWKWRWVVVKDVENVWYEDVKEMLDESWDEYLDSIEAVYGEIDVGDLEGIELV